MSKLLFIETLGCAMNSRDSEHMIAELTEKEGFEMTDDFKVADLTGTPSSVMMLELLSMAQTPCGLESANEATIELFSGAAIGRMSGERRRLEKNSLNVLQLEGSSYHPLLSPKEESFSTNLLYSSFHEFSVARY